MIIENSSIIPQAYKLNICDFPHRQHRSVTTTVKNLLGHLNFNTVVQYICINYTLNEYFIYK
jgi:hypothetical protein